MSVIHKLRRTWSKNRKKLIEALESGKFIQCFDYLKNNHGHFCVLGLALQVNDYYDDWTLFTFPDATLHILVNEYGLTREGAIQLAELNNKGKSFQDLAMLIKQDIKKPVNKRQYFE